MDFPISGQLLFVCFPGVTTHCDCIFTARQRALASSSSKFLDHTQQRATVGRTPLDELSIRRRDLYLPLQKSTPSVGFEPTISAGERPKTHTLDRVATGTGISGQLLIVYSSYVKHLRKVRNKIRQYITTDTRRFHSL